MIGIELKTRPQILHSDYLSALTGLNISILDYSCTDVGTHKLSRSLEIMGQAKEEGKEILFCVNPDVEENRDTESGRVAMELASAVRFPKSHVISFFHEPQRIYSRRTPVHPSFPDSRQRVEIGADLTDFANIEILYDLFRSCFNMNSGGLRDFLESRGIKNPTLEDCVDATNIFNVIENPRLDYFGDLTERLEDFDYVVGHAGTGERALGQIRSLKKPKHVIVVPSGHPLDPYHRYEKSDAKRVQTKFKVRAHDLLFQESIDRPDVIYKPVGNRFGAKQAKAFLDRAIEEEDLAVKTSKDGALSFAILRERDNPDYQRCFNQAGLILYNTLMASREGFKYLYNRTVIPFGANVCIVNTGLSNNNKLRALIEQGIVR
jgi:hypothetical protein